MNKMRKTFVCLLAMLLVFAASMPTMAAAATVTEHDANVKGSQREPSYTYYVMMKAAASNGAIEYYVEDEALAASLLNLRINGTPFCTVTKDLGKDYWSVTVNEEADFTEEEISEALATIKDNALASGMIENYEIELGYGALLLIESTIGTRTVMEASPVESASEVNDKNDNPTAEVGVDKKYAEIGGTVNYTVTVSISKGATNLKVYDTLSKGLTFGNDLTVSSNGQTVTEDWAKYTSVKTDGQGVQYSMTIPDTYAPKDGEETITITYSATLNDNALVNQAESNAVYVTYGDNSYSSTTSEVSVYTFGFTLNKVNGQSAPLEGVKFTLTRTDATGTRYYYTKSADGKVKGFCSEACELTTDANGNIAFDGLAAGTYTLTETAAAVGYTLPKNPVTVNISENGKVSIAGDNSAKADNNLVGEHYYDKVTVKNIEGIVIAETGGAGTTAFYIVGCLCVAAAGILFINIKKRGRSTVL